MPAHYDTATVHSIFNSTLVAHVSFVPDPSNPLPVVLPMIARIGQFPGDTEAHAYVHGYVTARLFKSGGGDDGTGELPVCLCATKIDALVLAITPFNHNYNYRSAILHGRARLLDPATDEAENLFAMRLITDGVCPDRWDNSRTPPDKTEITATRILKVTIESASAKVYDAGVKNDRKDLIREDVTGKVWNGIVPVYEVLGTPVPSKDNKVEQVPEHVEVYRKEFNKRAEEEEAGKKSGGLLSRLTGALW